MYVSNENLESMTKQIKYAESIRIVRSYVRGNKDGGLMGYNDKYHIYYKTVVRRGMLRKDAVVWKALMPLFSCGIPHDFGTHECAKQSIDVILGIYDRVESIVDEYSIKDIPITGVRR